MPDILTATATRPNFTVEAPFPTSGKLVIFGYLDTRSANTGARI